MNLKVVVALSVALLISLFANIALGFNSSDKSNQVDDLQAKNEELTTKMEDVQVSLDEAEGTLVNNQLADDGEARKVIEDFFDTQYNYTTETYVTRYEAIKKYVNSSVYGQLTAAGKPTALEVDVESKIQNLKLYMSTDDDVLSGLVLLDVTYTIEGLGNDDPMTQLYQVEVEEVDGEQKITHLASLGNFSRMTES
jgi:hypothetical protein